LLLEEPTSAMDVSVQAEVLNLLGGIRQKGALLCDGQTQSRRRRPCRRIAVMQRSNIVETISVADLRSINVAQPYTTRLRELSMGLTEAGLGAPASAFGAALHNSCLSNLLNAHIEPMCPHDRITMAPERERRLHRDCRRD
jgi:ABC-type dipeptide/oligopeptide/nickel transport system ATPase component